MDREQWFSKDFNLIQSISKAKFDFFFVFFVSLVFNALGDSAGLLAGFAAGSEPCSGVAV